MSPPNLHRNRGRTPPQSLPLLPLPLALTRMVGMPPALSRMGMFLMRASILPDLGLSLEHLPLDLSAALERSAGALKLLQRHLWLHRGRVHGGLVLDHLVHRPRRVDDVWLDDLALDYGLDVLVHVVVHVFARDGAGGLGGVGGGQGGGG